MPASRPRKRSCARSRPSRPASWRRRPPRSSRRRRRCRPPVGEPRLTLHDGSLAFATERATVYRDYIHFNPTGCRLMAAHLAAIVRARLGARPAVPTGTG